jgi:uncharacterized membrane protein YdjX (TVP38/TMEM64 family)
LPAVPNRPANGRVLAALSVRRLRRRTVVLLIVIILIAFGIVAMGWQKQISLESVVGYRAIIEAFVEAHRIVALAGYIAFYAAAAGLALPGVIFLTIGGGVFFGGLLGGIAAVIGATIGATCVFVVAKTALRNLLTRWLQPQIKRLKDGFRENAFNYLLFLRLIPIFPFSLGNLLPALCDVTLGTFISATFFGIAPMTFAISFFGAGLDRTLAAQIETYRTCLSAGMPNCKIDFDMRLIVTPQLAAGLIALGIAALLPVIVRRLRLSQNSRPISNMDDTDNH